MKNTVPESLGDYQKYIDLAMEYGSAYAVKLVLAFLIFWVGKMAARMITNGVVKTLRKKNSDEELIGFVRSLLYWALLVMVIIAALGQLGIKTASFIAILGAASLAIGLALQGSLSNFAAGVLILILRPFNNGDFVEIAGESGKVTSINIFTTQLLTGDNKCVIIPNARVLDSNIINHSSTGIRRVDLTFGIGYGDDIDKAKTVINKILEADDRVLKDQPIQIAVAELADSSVNFVVRPWVKTADYWGVLFDTTESVKKEFDKNSIEIPYPQSVVHLQNTNDA